jgi:NOL1/NOP2/fmu family ribosome biogenesis protein
MFRKSEIARQEWKPGLVKSCAVRQAAILEQAAQMVKPGGHLAYTTCTFSAEENEGVTYGFLSRHPEFNLVPISAIDGLLPSKPEWIDLPADHEMKHAVRIWPHLSQAEGHFIALLVKHGSSKSVNGSQPQNYLAEPGKKLKSSLPKSACFLLDEFCQANLYIKFEDSLLIQDGSYIYQLPAFHPNLAGLKVIRRGWWLGTITNRRFTPSHSLALSLKTTDARQTLSLERADPRLLAYVGGESFSDQGVDGWVLITVESYPLGWGKRVQNRIKNFYPHGLRHLA